MTHLKTDLFIGAADCLKFQSAQLFVLIILFFVSCLKFVSAQSGDNVKWRDCLNQKESWYASTEAIRIADNLLLYQNNSGGWFKNIDMAKELSIAEQEKVKAQKDSEGSTIDNNSTYTQLRYLAKVYKSANLDRLKDSFFKGFDYLIKAQYKNGGWPQFYPLIKGYYTHITFNDNAMIGVMNLLRDIVDKKPEFNFVDNNRIKLAEAALEKGIDCILKCQIIVNGKPSVWCAQHDEYTYAPAKARTYELPSFSGAESVGIVEFLMGIKKPSDKIIKSVKGAVEWFEKSKLTGIKQILVPDEKAPRGRNKIIVNDSSAPPLWARFYELNSNKPIFCSRDGIIHYDISEISYERRNGYNWLSDWPLKLLSEDYPLWQKKFSTYGN